MTQRMIGWLLLSTALALAPVLGACSESGSSSGGDTKVAAKKTVVEKKAAKASSGPTCEGFANQLVKMLSVQGSDAVFQKKDVPAITKACEQDKTMAALIGVDVDRTISLTFVMGAALAAVAGTVYLMYYGVIDFFEGFIVGIKAFTAAVLGGIGSLPGAMLGGMSIGLIEAFWSGYFTVEYKDVAVFGILVMVLVFRPSGLLGRPEIEKV